MSLFFVQDEWRWRQNFTITAGVRYETQNNIHSPFNFAPRLFFAWAPGATAKQLAKVVIRGGFGIFYERFNEFYTAESQHFGRDGQFDFIVTDPAIPGQSAFTLDGVSNVPALESLVNSQLRTTRITPSNLVSPYSMTGGLLAERQLPHRFILPGEYIFTLTRHALRSRNINALCRGRSCGAWPAAAYFLTATPARSTPLNRTSCRTSTSCRSGFKIACGRH